MHLAVRTIDFDYPLPEELIADRPLPDRAASRMMVIHRDTGLIEHRHFCDLPEYVREGDHFILNDTRVVPARYFSNDGAIEVVRAEVLNPLLWKCMVRPGRTMHFHSVGDKAPARTSSIEPSFEKNRAGTTRVSFRIK